MKKVNSLLPILLLCFGIMLCSCAAAEEALQAYVLHAVDQYGDPVSGVYVNFCTDTTCTPVQSDENGIITFDGEPDRYHVQLLKVPEGYSIDPDLELYTGEAYSEEDLLIRKDEDAQIREIISSMISEGLFCLPEISRILRRR